MKKIGIFLIVLVGLAGLGMIAHASYNVKTQGTGVYFSTTEDNTLRNGYGGPIRVDRYGQVLISSSTSMTVSSVGTSVNPIANGYFTNLFATSSVIDNLSILTIATSTGHIIPGTDNTYDLGAISPWNRWRTGYFGTSVVVGNGAVTSTITPLALTLTQGSGSDEGIFHVDNSGNTSASGTLHVFNTATLDSNTTIDSDNTEALLVRKNNDTGDVFVVDTSNARVGINTSIPNVELNVGGEARIGGGGTGGTLQVLGADDSVWFNVAAGTVYMNQAGGNTQIASAGNLGARLNVSSFTTSKAALALTGAASQTDNIFEVNSVGDQGGDYLHITADGTVVHGTGTRSDGATSKVPVEITTTDATQTTADSITLLDENTYHIKATVIGVQSDGSNRASYELRATAYRTGAGNATLQGAVTSIHSQESNAAWDATFTVSGNDVRVSVTGAAAATIQWVTMIEYLNMSN